MLHGNKKKNDHIAGGSGKKHPGVPYNFSSLLRITPARVTGIKSEKNLKATFNTNVGNVTNFQARNSFCKL